MQIAPSVLASDFTRLREELGRIPNADYIHLDIMDGHFVPNISYGPDVVAQLRKLTPIPFDVHLMITNPLRYLDRIVAAGADIVCFHIECEDDPAQLIREIKKAGKKPAVAVKPGTDISVVYPFVPELFMVLVMTVEPGFGGQSFMSEQLEKVRALKKRFPQLLVEVDGGINGDTVAACREAGVDICVAGTSVFRSPDAQAQIRLLQG